MSEDRRCLLVEYFGKVVQGMTTKTLKGQQAVLVMSPLVDGEPVKGPEDGGGVISSCSRFLVRILAVLL